jgi:hypothetical protein
VDRLEDIANVVTILGLPLMVLTWLITRERFSKFWNKRRRLILAIAGVVSVMSAAILLWRKGWLAWLQHPVTWPVWGLILYSIGLFFSPVVIYFVYRVWVRGGKVASLPDYYVKYGARWYRSPRTGRLDRPPWCATCLMPMRNLSMPSLLGSPIEEWECRQCRLRIEWNQDTQGDLLEEIAAYSYADLQRELEQQE